MTDLDAIIENAVTDRPTPAKPDLPQRPGLWRVVSLLAVVAALVITAIAVLQARDASDVPVPDRVAVALERATVTVSDITLVGGEQVSVLGLAESDSLQSLDASGTDIDLPQDMAALVAATNGDGDLIGMAVVPKNRDTVVEISPHSTARALLILSPGMLRPNLAESFANMPGIEEDAEFGRLVDALRINSNLSADNEAVELAYAKIVERIPARRPAADQGCDSVADPAAYDAAGTCVQPETTGVLITNEQDRWALIFSGTNGFTDVCAAVSPTTTEGSEVLVPSEQCSGEALLVTPGPVPLQNNDDQVIIDRVRTAAAVTTFYEYVAPFADLAGGSAGFSNEAVGHIRQNAPEIVDALEFVLSSTDEFVAATDVPRDASTALDRHTAAVASARHIIEASNTTALIPHRALGEDAHVDILDFYTRAGERMTRATTAWRWEVSAVGMVDFGADR